MKESELLGVVERQHKYRLSLLMDAKKKRTAGSKDRLINFKRIAAARGCEVQSVPLALCTKQFVDIVDMSNKTHPHSGDINYLKELVADVQNYLDITLAIAIEEEENN